MLQSSAEMFVQLLLELTVLFLLISYAVAVLNQKLPAEKIQRILGGRHGRGYITAAALGAITPFCSCSTIPMLVGLLKARAGFGPTMTFLFTSPLLNPLVIALFVPVFGATVTLSYALLALTVSLLAGWTLQALGFQRYIKPEMLETTSCRKGCNGGGEAIVQSQWRLAWDECWKLFKSMFPYMLVAMLIGALVHGFVPESFFTQVASADNPAAVPVAALIGIPLYMRVTTLLPLVGAFVAKGVSLGAVMALIIGSGGASLPEMILLKKLFYWPLLAAFLVVIFSMAVLGGFAFNAWLV